MDKEIDEAFTFYKIMKQLQEIFFSAGYTVISLSNNNILTAWAPYEIVYWACSLLVNTLQWMAELINLLLWFFNIKLQVRIAL